MNRFDAAIVLRKCTAISLLALVMVMAAGCSQSTPPPANPTAYRNGNNTVPPYVSGRVNGVDFGSGTIASQRVLNRVVAGPLWTAWLRSPHRLQNTFAHESFMDEIAASLKADPIQYRLRHIADPRLINVVNTVAQKANWETRP